MTLPFTTLSEREIHLWSASLDTDAEWLAPLLSPDERERAPRFRLERDRRRFIPARGWLRALLGSDLEFGYRPPAKPYAVGGVEVDLEAVRDIDRAEAIVRHHFAPAEIERPG